MKVLFLCTGNSCRSILAEATFNALAPPGWQAVSAGSRPTGQVHPKALALLKAQGLPTAGLSSKSMSALADPPDMVISVCGNAAGEECPVYYGKVLRAHWGVADPARAVGSDAEVEAAFETAYRILRARIEAFFALPLNDLSPTALEAEAVAIGQVLASEAGGVD